MRREEEVDFCFESILIFLLEAMMHRFYIEIGCCKQYI